MDDGIGTHDLVAQTVGQFAALERQRDRAHVADPARCYRGQLETECFRVHEETGVRRAQIAGIRQHVVGFRRSVGGQDGRMRRTLAGLPDVEMLAVGHIASGEIQFHGPAAIGQIKAGQDILAGRRRELEPMRLARGGKPSRDRVPVSRQFGHVQRRRGRGHREIVAGVLALEDLPPGVRPHREVVTPYRAARNADFRGRGVALAGAEDCPLPDQQLARQQLLRVRLRIADQVHAVVPGADGGARADVADRPLHRDSAAGQGRGGSGHDATVRSRSDGAVSTNSKAPMSGTAVPPGIGTPVLTVRGSS